MNTTDNASNTAPAPIDAAGCRPCGSWWAFPAFVFILLFVTAGRCPISCDADLTYLAARSFLDHGVPDLPDVRRVDVITGIDHRYYSKYPLGAVFVCLPPLLTEGLLRDVESNGIHFLAAAAAPAAAGALLAWGFFFVLLRMRTSPRVALFLAMSLILGTPLWVYARQYWGEVFQTAAVWWVWAFALIASDRPRKRWLLLLGLASGAALNLKSILILFAVAAVLYCGWRRRAADRSRIALWVGLGILPGILTWLWFNWLRFGNPLSLGYGIERDATLGFSVPLWAGLYGLLFSSGKSIFLYAPPLLLSLPALGKFVREHRAEALSALFPSLGLLLLVSKWWAWNGDWAWGPRLVVPILPFLLLPAARLDWRKRMTRACAVFLIAAGIAVQLLGLLVPETHYLAKVHQMTARSYSPSGSAGVRDDLLFAHFVPEFSPIVVHLWFLRGFIMEPAQWLDACPWKSLHVSAWSPHADWRLPFLNVWFDGSAPAWVALLVLTALAALLGGRVYSGWCRR